MKNCPYCTRENLDEAIFCNYCGRDLNKINSSQSTDLPPRAKSNNKKISIILIIIFVLAICVIYPVCFLSQIWSTTNNSNNTTPLDTNNSKPTSVMGSVRSNPIPRGFGVTADNMDFYVTKTIRPADHIVTAGNMFNTKPEQGYEYIFVELWIKCNKTTDKTCYMSPFDFEMIGNEGIVYDSEWMLAGVEGMLERKEFYGEATISGYIAYIVKSSDTTLILSYDPFLGQKFYMSIE